MLTQFGVLVLVIGSYLLLRGTTLVMLLFVMITTLFGGSSAFNLPTGSSILPGVMATLFLALRTVLPSNRPAGTMRAAFDANLPLILFTFYGIVGALVLPFIFAGVIDVVPLRPVSRDPFTTQALVFTSQNLTSAGYLFTTTLAALCAYGAVQAANAEMRVARVSAIIAITHATLGLMSVALAGTPLIAFFKFFRNALYNQLDQEVAGFSRMSGIFAEPSNFAGFGFIYFVFVVELWLRQIDRRWTGTGAALLLIALVVSTSTTAYVGLAGYALILMFRQIVFPQTISAAKLLTIASGASIIAVAAVVILAVWPQTLKVVDLVYRMMIVKKTESESGLVRLLWARQGVAAFWASGGLGVGVGSFRSSSLGTAILGSMGIIGVVTYAAQMLRVFQPLRRSTFVQTGNPRIDVGVAATWTIIALTIPSFVSAPSADPGLNWGLMVGIALGLRTKNPKSYKARYEQTLIKTILH